MTRTIDQMIASEVLCCMSSLVATLAGSYGNTLPGVQEEMRSLLDQAQELAMPVDDWEETAIQNGWRFWKGEYYKPGVWLPNASKATGSMGGGTAQQVCEYANLEPIATEVYEHWAVTDWFADKLEAAGEKVDRDFAGLCVWARTTTGQQIAADGVVARIYAQTHTA